MALLIALFIWDSFFSSNHHSFAVLATVGNFSGPENRQANAESPTIDLGYVLRGQRIDLYFLPEFFRVHDEEIEKITASCECITFSVQPLHFESKIDTAKVRRRLIHLCLDNSDASLDSSTRLMIDGKVHCRDSLPKAFVVKVELGSIAASQLAEVCISHSRDLNLRAGYGSKPKGCFAGCLSERKQLFEVFKFLGFLSVFHYRSLR